MILSELKYIKPFIITNICGCGLKYKPILIYYIYNFYKSLYDMSLNFRLLLDTFPVAIVADIYFPQIPVPVFGIRETEITNWLLPNITSSSSVLLRALLLGGSFCKPLSVRDLNTPIRKSVNDVVLIFVYIFITKLSMAFMSTSVTSLALFPRQVNISSKSEDARKTVWCS